jgi:hypothetical protein
MHSYILNTGDVFSVKFKTCRYVFSKKGFFVSIIYRLSQQTVLGTTLVEKAMPCTAEV